MKRILTALFVLSLLTTSSAVAADYGWSLSNSSTDPTQNTGAPTPGALTQVYE